MKREPSSNLELLGVVGKFAKRGSAKRTYRHDDDKSNLRCTHYGGTRHTKDDCFKLVGYPKWWPDEKKKGTKMAAKPFDNGEQRRTGRAAIGLSVDMKEGDEQNIDGASIGVAGGQTETLENSNGASKANRKMEDGPLKEGEGHLGFEREEGSLNKGEGK